MIKIFFYCVCFIILNACQSPMGAAQFKPADFLKKYPQNFQTYQSGDRKMRFAFSGDSNKRPLIFVHGSPGSWEAWVDYLMSRELQKDFQIIAVDRPGYGGSESGRVEKSLQRQASDIMAALQFNHSGLPAILVGHSLGGPVVARMAMDFSEQVAGVIFVAGSEDPDLEKIKWIQYPANWSFFRWMIPAEILVCNDEIMPLKAELQLMTPLWPKIKAKVFILHGDQDDLVPIANVDYLLKKLNPDLIIKVIRIPGMNHFIPWKRSDLIFEGIATVQKSL